MNKLEGCKAAFIELLIDRYIKTTNMHKFLKIIKLNTIKSLEWMYWTSKHSKRSYQIAIKKYMTLFN